MNINSKIAITGHSGFIGSELYKGLSFISDNVIRLHGDVRDPNTFAQIDHTFDYLFHFGAPSSQVLFAKNDQYCTDVTINGFLNAATACRNNGVKLIYPSTGLLSMGEANEYARCKKICEDIAIRDNLDALGIRIFATYGEGEGHKGQYASVPYLFAKDIVDGRKPVVFGDGKQTRDFIYIDDTVEGIIALAKSGISDVVDLGSGIATSFIDVIEKIQNILDIKDPIKFKFVDKPQKYVEKTIARPNGIYTPRISIDGGLKPMVESIYQGENDDD